VLQAEWGLTERQTASITASVFAGQLIGALCLGGLGDRIGRRPTFCLAATIIFVFGVTTSLAKTYETLVAMRFAVGFGVGGASVPFDVLAEFLPNSNRGKNLLYIEYFWTAGTLSVPFLAWLSIGDGISGGSWQFFVILCAIPCLASAILGVIFVPESPRWLLAQGRSVEAMTVLRRAAKENGHDPHDLFPEAMQLEEDDEEESGICDLLAPRWRKISFALWAVFFCYSFAYYGTILAITRVFDDESSSSAQVGGDDTGYNFNYSAILKSSAGEVLGTTLVVMSVDRIGRVASQIFCYVMGGLSVFVFCWYASYENSSGSVLVLLAFLVRAFEMGSSCVTVLSAPELLPTKVRTTGHSVASAIGRIGAFLCPFLVSESTPLKTIGTTMLCIHIVTVFSAYQFPETSGLAMGRVHDEQETQRSNISNDASHNSTDVNEEFDHEIHAGTLHID